MNVSVMVKKLYIVFASATGLWFGNFEGSLFLYTSMVKLVFQDARIFFVCSNR